MSWILRVDRTHIDEPSGVSKYEVDGFRANPSWASVGPSELELSRKVILSDLEKILPIIMTSSIRFRSGIKFPIQDQEPIDQLVAIGKKIYLDLNTEVKETLKGAISIHLVTNDMTIPWGIMHDGKQFVGLKYPFGISPMIKRHDLEREPKRNAKLKVLFIVDTKITFHKPEMRFESFFSLMEKDIKRLAVNRITMMKIKFHSCFYFSMISYL